MSGHSKWASIKHKKAITDSKKGKEFTKAAANITIAAKQGGGDAKMNFSLRLAIDKAKSVNMPSSNIERAIKKGTGELGGAAPEELLYEGYAIAGVAILVETLTDNRNRTGPEIKAIFSKNGGSLAETGSVAYLFDKKGEIIIVNKNQKIGKEDLEMIIIDSGADDFEENEEVAVVYTKSNELQKVKAALEASEIKIEDAELVYKPKTGVKIDDLEVARKILHLTDALEENEDVTSVYSNYDIEDSILEKL
ncbi:MAG: YebC/PmpR family DNA-binding transcriptional regulator [bacterium]